MPQCLGRLIVERKNIPEHKFIGSKAGFFLPKRCSEDAVDGLDICKACEEKRRLIPHRLQQWKGSMQNQSSQFHGKVTEPIPEWSRIYKGIYYFKMLEKGLSVDSNAVAAAEAAVTDTLKETLVEAIKECLDTPVEMVNKKIAVTVEESQPSPKKRVVIKKKIAESPKTPSVLEALANSPSAEEPVTPAPIVARLPLEKPKRSIKPKKASSAVTPAPPIAGIVKPGLKAEQPIVVKVKLQKTEIDGRTVYLQSEKDKVFDLKFQYLGRYDRRNDCIVSGYPDSDAEQRV